MKKEILKTIRLKHCPFCGSRAKIEFDHCGTNMYECNIKCSNTEELHAYCVARGRFDKAVERWNTRANSEPEDVFIEVGDRKWIPAEEEKYRGSVTDSLLQEMENEG